MQPETTPPQPRRLRRSRTDRVIAGVCGGLADYFGLNAIALRLIWLVMALLGLGILLYLLAWLIIPAESRGAGGIPPHRTSGRVLFGLLLIAIGLVVLYRHLYCDFFWTWIPFSEIVLPIGLVIIGAILLATARTRPLPLFDNTEPPLSASQPVSHPEQQSVGPEPFRRSRKERLIAGLCGAIGLRWGVDPALIRVGWAAATLLTQGLGLIIYLLLWLIIPLESERHNA